MTREEYAEYRKKYLKKATQAFEIGDKNSGEYYQGIVTGLDLAFDEAGD